MNLHHIISPDRVLLRLMTTVPEPEEGEERISESALRDYKEEVLGEIAEVFESSPSVGHINRLRRELILREGKASTAVGRGVAFPHIRTLQVREMLGAIALAPEGIPFGSPDGELVHLIVMLVSPKGEERAHLNLVRRFSEVFQGDAALAELLQAQSEHEVIRILDSYL